MNVSKPLNTYLVLVDSHFSRYSAIDLQELDVACSLWPYLCPTYITLVPNGFENKKNFTRKVLYQMRNKLLANKETLLGMFNRFGSDKLILDYIGLYTSERADFLQSCPILATSAFSPFKECIIYFAFEELNGQ
jgi:hypothetical protein